MKRFAYLALAGLTLLAACDSGNSGGGTTTTVSGTISGTVSIEGTGVSGVNVTLSSGATTTTASGGAYSFSNVPAGAYTVSIDVSGHADAAFASTSKAATISTDGQVVPVDFSGSYIRTASILGSVSAGGTGIAGVSVSAQGPDASPASAVTDANGQYHLTGLRAGTYTVTISNIPTGYTFATTSATVTVAVGGSQSAPFVGQGAGQTQTTASVVIKSVTAGGTFFPVNPAAVAGQIDVTLQIDPGTNNLSQVCVMLNGTVVANGCQTLSSMVAAQTDAQKAGSVFEPTFSILTNAFDGNTGAPTYLNGAYTLSAKVDLVNATQASVSTSMQLTFANADAMVATLTPGATAVGAAGGAAPGQLWYGGTQTVNLMPVLFSGKTLQTATVTFSGKAGVTATATTFPGTVTFKGAVAADPLFNYQSAAINVDNFTVGGALYTDGTTAAGLNGARAVGPNGNTANIDEVPPATAGVLLNLTDQTAIVAPATAPVIACCSNNWVGPDYKFANGLAGAAPADAGVGLNTTTFHVAPAGTALATALATAPVTLASDANLSQSLVNTENGLWVKFTDLLGNASSVALTGVVGSANLLNTFGYDNTAPTGQKLAAGDLADHVVFNAGAAPATGPGPLTFSASEDRSGFSGRPVQIWAQQITAAGTTYPIANGATTKNNGPVNEANPIPVCAAQPTNAAPCTPNKTVNDGYYHYEAWEINQAGIPSGTVVSRDALVDQTIPTQNNVNLPSQVRKNTTITVAVQVNDNLDLWSTAFGFDFGGDGVFIPFGDVYSFQTNRWDVSSKSDLITSGTATLTVDAVVAREQANGAGGIPNAATLASATNVRAITLDAAGNSSGAVQNNFIVGTVDAGTDYGAGATPNTGWNITAPAAGTFLCNTQGTTACPAGDGTTAAKAASSTSVTVVAQGAAGTYPFPFGTSGKVWFYLTDGGGAYVPATHWYLLGAVTGTSATITDAANRNYTYSFSITKDMVASFPSGAVLNVVAIGFNPATGTALISNPSAGAVTIANGS